MDGDGLDDRWEKKYFGDTTSQDATGNPDKDRYNNLQEYKKRTDPKKNDDPASGDPNSNTDNIGSGNDDNTLLWVVIGASIFFLIVVIVFLIVIISRRSKRRREEEEDLIPTPVEIPRKDLEAEELYGRVSPSDEALSVTTTSIEEDTEDMESIEVDREAMESFFSTVDEGEQPALLPSGGPFEGTAGPGLFASMKEDENMEEPYRALTRDILAEKTPKEDRSLSLDSLFSPIMDDEEEEEAGNELLSELAPVKSEGFGDKFLDDLLTLVPFEDDDMKTVGPAKGSARIEEDIDESEEAPLEVACYNCTSSIPIYTDERPLIITCPGCGAQGEIE